MIWVTKEKNDISLDQVIYITFLFHNHLYKCGFQI